MEEVSLAHALNELSNQLTGSSHCFDGKGDRNKALLRLLELVSGELKSLQRENRHLKSQIEGLSIDDGAIGEELDRFYLEFENRYRGSEQSVKESIQFYINDIAHLESPNEELQILDLGCGRGEWLEILSEQGYSKARGIDLNKHMVEKCQGKGLQVEHGNAFDALKACHDNQLDVITGFHIVEHLSFKDLLRLLKLCRQRLKPSGILIFETPNPRNIMVGSNTFHFDPTHVKPLPIELLSFTGEFIGFKLRALHQRNPFPELLRLADTLAENSNLLKSALACGLDYGVVFEKPN